MAYRGRMLSVHEVADRFGSNVRYVRYLIETRQIEFVRLGRRKVRIAEDVVDAFIAAGTVPARRQVAA